jgi:hypothetical protein
MGKPDVEISTTGARRKGRRKVDRDGEILPA